MAPFSLIAGATRPQRSGAAPHEPAVRRTSNKAAPSIRGSAPPATRERMVGDPRLFLDALRANDERRADEHLRDGPEGECVVDMRCLEAVIARLTGRVAALQSVPPALIAAVPRLWLALDVLTIAIDRGDGHDPG